jgi:hypothetical protein
MKKKINGGGKTNVMRYLEYCKSTVVSYCDSRIEIQINGENISPRRKL